MVIVIGGTGFIGVYTVERLIKDGYKVLATGRNKSCCGYFKNLGADFVELDITNKNDFKKLPETGVEAVILLAGLLPANEKVDIKSNENADDYINVNVNGTINVLEYCRLHNIKKVISTTSYADVANAWRKNYAIKETEPRNFKFTGDHAVYVISKNAATDMILYYNCQHGMQGSIFRLPPVYGVGPHSEIYVNGKYYKTGIQTFIENAISGKPIEIWGNPNISRDIVYVKDIARAFSLAIKSDKAEGLYNMTLGKATTLYEQVETVIKIFGKDKKSQIVMRPDKKNNTPSFLFDMTKAENDFGFVPEYDNFEKMMIDYKNEMESGRFDFLIKSRKKR